MNKDPYGGYGGQVPAGYPQGGYPQQGAYGYPPQASMYPPVSSAAGPSAYQHNHHQQQQQQPYNQYQQPFGAKPYQQQQRFNDERTAYQNTLNTGMDVESQTAMNFATTQMRNGFVRKVFSIVSLQLLITVGFTCWCLFDKPVKAYLRQNQWLFYTAWVVSIALLLVLACSEKARRSHPTNIILLALFTCAEAFLVGMISSYWDTQVVLIAFVATAAVVVGITIAAFQTKLDVTRWTSVLFMATIILIVMTLVGIFWRNKVFHLVIAAVGALLFSVWLLFDLQMLLGGKRHELSPDEYVFAALTIYIDIVSIFLYLMQVIGISQQM